MKLLLDTHIFLWFISNDSRLALDRVDAIADPANEVYLSVASAWEMIVKHQIGKLSLPEPPDLLIPKARQRHLIHSLSIDELSAVRLMQLPLLHRDPFDRMLIAQAIEHNLVLMTSDSAIRAYPVATM